MLNIIKALLFAGINAAGFYVVPLIIRIAIMIGFFPDLPEGPFRQQLFVCLFQLSFFVWAVPAAASTGYFFARGEIRNWLLLAPLYVPALYGLLVFVYFNFTGIR